MEYPKIETLFDRDEKTHKVIPSKLRKPVFGTFKSWQFTEKIDGTNIRVLWQPAVGGDLLTQESLTFGGKTANAQIHADLIKWLYENVKLDKLREIFPDAPAVIYGEGYGAGIQKGGAYSTTKRLIVFDVLVGEKWWLDWENTCDVATKLGLKTVPFIGELTLEDGIERVRSGFHSLLAHEQTGMDVMAEGLVGRTLEPLFDKRGHRVIIKLKTRDF